jgi:hypothetical protein
MYVCIVFVFALFSTQPGRAATFHFLGGIQDNYTPPTEPANPSASLQTWLGSSTYSPYDSTTINQRFAETFVDCPMCITGAQLQIGLKPLTGVGTSGATNDTLRFGFTDGFGNQVVPYWIKNIGWPATQQSILPQNWGTQNYPNGVVLTLDLAALPLGNSNSNGSTANLVPSLRKQKFLNVDVQDDTAVDFIDFQITTALAGDMNGDGCVDANDLALLTAYFGQSTPAGVGDPNGDGVINLLDLGLLQADFGKCCPEPASVALAGIAVVAGLWKRRRVPRLNSGRCCG